MRQANNISEQLTVRISFGVLHLLSLGSESVDRHEGYNVRRQVLPMVSSENFSVQKVSDQSDSIDDTNDLPGPPLEKFVHPGLCSWSRGVFKEIYDIVPENLIVEVSVHCAPGGEVGKCKANLQNSFSFTTNR